MPSIEQTLTDMDTRLNKLQSLGYAIINRLDDPAYVVKVPRQAEENADKDKLLNERLERIESQVALNMHNNNMLQVSMHNTAERLEALEKHNRTAEGDKMTINDLYARVGVLDVRTQTQGEITNGLCSSALKQQTTIDNLCGRLEALERKVDANTDIAREWRKASRCNQEDRDKTLACAYNDLHSRLADIEGNAALIYNGVFVPTRKG